MTKDTIAGSRLGELLHRVGEISASSGKTKEAIDYLEKSVDIMEHLDVSKTLVNERRLHLAKVRSRASTKAEASNEARTCFEQNTSLEAQRWLACCLRKEGHLQESLSILKGILSEWPIDDPEELESQRELLIVMVETASISADIGDPQSTARARELIDQKVAPFINGLPLGHPVRSDFHKDVLLCRIQVASDPNDLQTACLNVVKYDAQDIFTLSLPGGRPQHWLRHVAALHKKKRHHEIEMFVETYSKSRPSILDMMVLKTSNHFPFELIDETALGWCRMYNLLGKAYFEQGEFGMAEKAHMNALGLHLFVHSEGSRSPIFQLNVYNLQRVLFCQGASKQDELKEIQANFGSILADIENRHAALR
jgi:hypothetical protein